MRVRDYLGISKHRQEQAARAMQLSLVGFFFVGLYRGNPGIVVNSGLGFLITYIPAILEQDYDIPMDAGLTLWITMAVFLHALGTVGLPGSDASLYGPGGLSWWDHLTHMLSSSLVAAAGYSTVRAIDEHNDDIYLPPKFMFVFVLLFVMAFGVIWELIEFGVAHLGSLAGGKILTIYGADDTMLDLVFDAIGGIIVAIWGTAYLTDVSQAIRSRFESDAAGE